VVEAYELWKFQGCPWITCPWSSVV
jgi:hypothetical protein